MKEKYKEILLNNYGLENEEVEEMTESEMLNILFEDYDEIKCDVYGEIIKNAECFYHYEHYLIRHPVYDYTTHPSAYGYEYGCIDFLESIENADDEFSILNNNEKRTLKNLFNIHYCLQHMNNLEFSCCIRNDKNFYTKQEELERKYNEFVDILINSINEKLIHFSFDDWLYSL